MTRVAALIDTVQVSGPGRQLAALASSLSKSGVELTVVTFHRAGRDRSPYLDYLEQAGVHYVVVPESGPLDAGLPARLRRAIAECAPDILQTHGYKPTALVWALRRGGLSQPWVAFFHGATTENIKVRLYHWFTNRLLGAADRVVVMSRAHLAHFSRLGEKACVVHNAVLALPPEPSRGATAPTVDGIRPRIGVVGRLSPEKGVDVFLHACHALAQRGVSFSAVVAGDGPERARLERLRDTLDLAGRVDFIGAISTVASLYASLDLLVIPSRSEGLPNVLLEALRADVPVVATRVGAIPDVLNSPRAGLVVPPGSAAALAEGIARALPLRSDPAARNARRLVVDRFSLERRVAEHVRIYDEVLHRRTGPRHPARKPVVDRGPLKIEMVLPAMAAAGMEAMTARLTRALAARGHDVGITCIETGGVLADELRAEGFRVAVVPALGLRSIVRAPLLESWLRSVAPDVVHVHSGAWLKAAHAARRSGVPRVVHTVHGLLDDEPWYVPLLHRQAARYTDWIAPVSTPLRDYLARRVRMDTAKVRVIPNGVNTDHFHPGPPTGALRVRLGITGDRLVVGTVARLDPVKNHALLIDAFARIRALVPDAVLVLIGDGPLRGSLESRARRLGVGEDVHFFGASNDVAALYRDLDVFVLSSNAEGTSMSILEAMASGVCVVATAVGGTSDLLAGGATGMLVPPGDPDALAGALAVVLRDGARRRRLADMGRARAEAHYSEPAMIESYEALYRGAARPSAERETLTASAQCAE